MNKKKEEKQIDSIFEAIINLAQLNYSTKAIITDSNTQLDAIASGVNMMGEQLEHLVNSEKEKTEFLKNSEEISHLGSWELKLLTNQLIWSDEVYRLFGLQPQEFTATYEAFLDAVHPDDRAKVDAAYTNSVKEGKDCYEIEHRLLNSKTGELKYVIEKCRHERNASGNIIRSIGFVQDITERKKAEESIRQSEMRLNAAQTITKLGSWEADLITGAVVWSDELYRIYNCNPQSFTPSVEALISLLHPDYKKAMSNWIAGTMQGKEQTPLEVQLANGSNKWIRSHGQVVFDENGKPVKARGTGQDITENKEAEIALEKSNREITDLKHGLDEASIVAITNTKGIIQYANNNFCKISGYSREELIGQDHRIINSGYHTKKFIRELWVTIANGKIWKGELKNKAKDGSYYWVDTTIVPFLDRKGKPFQYAAIRINITDRKKVEEELLTYKNQLEQKVQDRTTELSNALEKLKKNENLLRESHEQLQKLTDKILVAIYQFEITADGKMSVPFVSKSIEELLPGVTAEQVMNDAALVFASVHPEDLQALMQSIYKSRQQLTEWRRDFRMVTQDGAIKWMTGSSRQEKKENGTTVWFGYLEDVTEKKKAEDQIFKSQQRYKNLLDNMNDGFIVDDANGKVIFANKKFLEIFGLAEDDIPTLVLEDYIAPDYRAMIRERHNRRIAGEPVPANFEYVGLTKQGKKIWLGVRVSPIIENGIIIGTQSVIRDISEIKKAEDEMNRYNVELKKTNSELDRFVYSTSHDLRAPLKSMLGLIGITRENLEPSNIEQMERIDMLSKSVLKLDDFIQDILHYARNSRMEVAKEEINFEKMINDIRHNHKFMEGAIGLKVTVKIRQAEKFISDKERIKVILNNLISNGIKYKDNSKENSSVNIMVQGSKENTIITVEDNGIGIAEDKQEKIFEMFYRATKQSTGSGLGLYIVKETIEKLDGQITMESILNKGSKFVVSLPNQFVTLT